MTLNKIQIQMLDQEVQDEFKREMFPSLRAIKLEGMTVGNLVLTRSNVILGTIVLG